MSKLGRGTFYLSISSVGYMLSGYATNVWLGRHLGPVYYGLYGVIIGLITAANIIQTSGLPQATSKYIAEDESQSEAVLRASIKLQFISTILISLIVFLSAHLLARLFRDARLTEYLQISALIFPVYGLFAIYVGYFNGLHNFSKQALISIVYSLTKIVAVIGLSLYFRLFGVIFGFVIAPLVALFFAMHIPKSALSISYRKLLKYSLPLTIFALLSALQITIDLFFVKANLPDKSAGYYAASQSISLLPYVGLNAIGGVLFPQVSQSLGRREFERLRKVIIVSMRYVLMMLVPVTALIAATSRTLIHLLYGKAFLPASASLSILVLGYAFLTLFIILANILNGAGEGRRSWMYAGSGILIALVGYILLIKSHGLSGAAISTTIGAFVSLILAARAVWILFRPTFPTSSFLRITGAGVLIYGLALFIPASTSLLIPMYVAMFSIYIGVLISIREFNNEDRRQLREILPMWLPFLNWL